MAWQKAAAAALIGGLIFASQVSTVSAVETPADPAQQDAQKKSTLPIWQVACSNQNVTGRLLCRTEQALFVTKTRQRIIGVAFEVNNDKALPLKARIHLPHGIKLAAGVQLWVDDGKKRPLEITYADADGSYAVFPVDEALAAELKKGQILRMQVEALAGNKTIFELKLEGIAAALKYVEAFK